MPLGSVQSEAHAIAGRYKWYTWMMADKSSFVQENGTDWEWVYDVRRPIAVAFETNVQPFGNVTELILIDYSSISIFVFHNNNVRNSTGITYDTRDLSSLDSSFGLIMSDW